MAISSDRRLSLSRGCNTRDSFFGIFRRNDYQPAAIAVTITTRRGSLIIAKSETPLRTRDLGPRSKTTCATVQPRFPGISPFNRVAPHRHRFKTSADKSFYSVVEPTSRERREGGSERDRDRDSEREGEGEGEKASRIGHIDSTHIKSVPEQRQCGGGVGVPSSNYAPGKSSGWAGKAGWSESRVEKFSSSGRGSEYGKLRTYSRNFSDYN